MQGEKTKVLRVLAVGHKPIVMTIRLLPVYRAQLHPLSLKTIAKQNESGG